VSLEAVLAAAAPHVEDGVRHLRAWVETNSYSGNVDGANAMSRHLQDAFALAGLELMIRTGNGVGDHLCWRTPAWDAPGAARTLLVGHHDTVFPPGTFEGWQRLGDHGDRIRGPGTLDMKGGLAIIYAALATLAETGLLAELPVALLSVADEEIGSPDSRPFAEAWARGASAVLVFEAGRAADAIITRRKGTGGMTVRTTGRAAHAGNQHADGVNAIWALARFIDRAQALTDYAAGVTVNVGVVTGGTSRNTVPARAECGLDFRFVRESQGHELCAALDQLARELGGATGASFTLEGGVRRPPLERTEASAALCKEYAACARAAGLGGGEAPLIGGGSDGNNLAALGIPVIDGLGPRGHGFHTHDETIEASSLALRTDALLRFLWGRYAADV
jgi:glutamate carboxypeptidase